MTDDFRAEIQEKFSDMAVRPLRCLALAVKVYHNTAPSPFPEIP